GIAVDRVVAGGPRQGIVARGPVERDEKTERLAGQAVVAASRGADRDGVYSADCRDRAKGIQLAAADRDRGDCVAGKIKLLDPGDARDPRDARAATYNQSVVARAAIDAVAGRIAAGCNVDAVVAVRTGDRIRAGSTGDVVVAGAAVDGVTAGVA